MAHANRRRPLNPDAACETPRLAFARVKHDFDAAIGGAARY